MSEPEFIILPREALLEFFGAMALPPWTDERGRKIGGRIECAPIAETIVEWLDSHELPADAVCGSTTVEVSP